MDGENYQAMFVCGCAAAWDNPRFGDRRAVAPLVSALDDRAVREAASEALSLLGWRPDMLKTGAEYPMTTGGRARAAETGTPAEKPLVPVFANPAEELGPDAGGFAVERLVRALDD